MKTARPALWNLEGGTSRIVGNASAAFDRSKKNVVWEGHGERLPASSGAENQPQ